MSIEKIWRYMDFAKFVSMLSTGGLWFAKAATFYDDPWEGYGRVKHLCMSVADNFPKVIRQETPDGKTTYISTQQMRATWSQRSAAYVNNAPEHLYVNSWFLGDSESMAMWDIYGSNGRGVAIQSTVDVYQSVARFKIEPEQFLFGHVIYHEAFDTVPEILYDFTENIPFPGSGLWPKLLNLALHKRSCYEHENEWRAVIYQDPKPELKGIVELFDLKELVHQIVIGPRAETFVVEAVSAVTEKFLPQKSVRQSRLLQQPTRPSKGG